MGTRRIVVTATIAIICILVGSVLLVATNNRSTLPTLSTPAGQITITGQIIPDLNTDMQERQIVIEAGEPLDDLKYYLYDTSGVEYRLQFDAALLAALGDDYFEQHPFYKSIKYYAPERPDYMGRTAIWQEWTGKWSAVTGNLLAPNLLQVHSMQQSKHDLETATLKNAMGRRAKQVTFIGMMNDAVSLQPVENDGPTLFTIKDESLGTIQLVLILDHSPKSFTRIVSSDNKDVATRDKALVVGQSCTVSGWMFVQYQTGWPEIPLVLYSQSIQIN